MKKFLSFFLPIFFVANLFGIYLVQKADAGGFQTKTILDLTSNKNSTIANGSDAITFSVHAYYYQCDYEAPNNAGHPTTDNPQNCAGFTPPTYTVIGAAGTYGISVNGSGNILSASSANTDGSGYGSFTLKSTKADSKTVSISAGSIYGIPLTSDRSQNVKTVTFTTPTASTTTSNKSSPTSTEQPNPAVPVLEKLKVGNTELALDKVSQNTITTKAKLTFSGKTIPNAKVILYFQSEPFTAETTSDKDGNWAYTLDRQLEPGEHSLQIAVTDLQTGKTSERSEPFKFTIKKAEEPKNVDTTKENTLLSFLKTPFAIVSIALVFILIGFLIFRIVERKKKPVSRKEESRKDITKEQELLK